MFLPLFCLHDDDDDDDDGDRDFMDSLRNGKYTAPIVLWRFRHCGVL